MTAPHDHSDSEANTPREITADSARKWPYYPIETLLPSAGYYASQLDGTHFSDVVVSVPRRHCLTRLVRPLSAPMCEDSGLRRTLADSNELPADPHNRLDHTGFALITGKRTTGLEPATFGLGSQRSTN
jgi:hypothetical protein